MATYWDATYTGIKNLVTDFLRYEGGEVSDYPLNIINRAQDRLWERRYWDYLLATSTLSLTNRSSSLPSDFGRIYQVYVDGNSDGKPDASEFYFRNCSRRDRRYVVAGGFTKAAGHSWTITFTVNPSGSPILKYQKALTHFTGSGTEYSYFPEQLVALQAYLIHTTEKGISDPQEHNTLKIEFIEAIRDYEQAHQYQNNEMVMDQNDYNGEQVANDYYDLDGGSEMNRGNYANDYDLGV